MIMMIMVKIRILSAKFTISIFMMLMVMFVVVVKRMITRISVDDDDEISQNYDWSGDIVARCW